MHRREIELTVELDLLTLASMLVGLDIDGVLADFVPAFLRILAERVGTGPIDPESITDPNFTNHPFLSAEMVSRCVADVSSDPLFWKELAPLPSPEQWRALDALSRDKRLIFITHRYLCDSYDVGRVTCDWLGSHGVSEPVVYFTQGQKSELITKLNVELFVDDRHENCRDAAEHSQAVVMMPHRAYNGSFAHPKVQRIQELAEIFAFLDGRPRP
jgi:uncharacterized HAD superfamily protein